MGANCCGEAPLPDYVLAANKVLAQLEPVLFATKLKKPFVGQIRKIFDSIDAKKRGLIRIEQIEDYLQTPKLPYVRKILGMFNHDNSGIMDFPEFLMMAWMYCTMDLFTLPQFIFDSLDTLHGGYITYEDLCLFIQDLYGPNWRANPEPRLIIRDIPFGNLLLSDVKKVLNRHPEVNGILMSLRNTMRSKIGGSDHWAELMLARNRMKPIEEKNTVKFAVETLSSHKPSAVDIFDEEAGEVDETGRSDATEDLLKHLGIAPGMFKKKAKLKPIRVVTYLERDTAIALHATAKKKAAKKVIIPRPFRDWKDESLMIVRDSRPVTAIHDHPLPTPESISGVDTMRRGVTRMMRRSFTMSEMARVAIMHEVEHGEGGDKNSTVVVSTGSTRSTSPDPTGTAVTSGQPAATTTAGGNDKSAVLAITAGNGSNDKSNKSNKNNNNNNNSTNTGTDDKANSPAAATGDGTEARPKSSMMKMLGFQQTKRL